MGGRGLKNARRRRTCAFRRLWLTAQTELDYAPHLDDLTVDLPEAFWFRLQSATDAYKVLRDSTADQAAMRNEFFSAPEGSEERKKLLKHLGKYKRTLARYQELQDARERKLLAIVKPYLVVGDDPTEESATSESAKDSLMQRWNALTSALQRFDRLDRDHHRDLLKFLRADKSHTKDDFDQQYFRSRTKATRELIQAEKAYRALKRVMQVAGELHLEDMTSAFPTFSIDGRAPPSIGSAAERRMRQRRQLNRRRIENYRTARLLAGPPARVSAPPTEPSELWSGSSFKFRGIAPTVDLDNDRAKQRIRNWRERGLENFGAGETGYVCGGFTPDREFGFAGQAEVDEDDEEVETRCFC
jgi:hypothetical protein